MQTRHRFLGKIPFVSKLIPATHCGWSQHTIALRFDTETHDPAPKQTWCCQSISSHLYLHVFAGALVERATIWIAVVLAGAHSFLVVCSWPAVLASCISPSVKLTCAHTFSHCSDRHWPHSANQNSAQYRIIVACAWASSTAFPTCVCVFMWLTERYHYATACTQTSSSSSFSCWCCLCATDSNVWQTTETHSVRMFQVLHNIISVGFRSSHSPRLLIDQSQCGFWMCGV